MTALSQPNVAPPRGFRPALAVRRVSALSSPPPFSRRRKKRGARRRGELYEAAAHKEFSTCFPWGAQYIKSPWFQFYERDSPRPRYCQPDALLVFPELRRLLILEMKLQHTAAAWWQVCQLYKPVLEWMFLPGAWEICCVEIVKWFDPAVAFPERPAMVPDLLAVEPGRFSVHIWNPKRG